MPETASDLQTLVEQTEAVDWRDVPGVTAAEAAAWTARCVEALEEM